MLDALTILSPALWAYAMAAAVVAGVIKGMVGFAMPMVLISALSSVIAPDLALAGLILPTLVTNGMQAFRQGVGEAMGSVRRFKVFLLALLVMLMATAQLVRVLPQDTFLLAIGVPVAVFALMQLAGVRFHLAQPSRVIEAAVGGFAGAVGGMSGVWGPPTVAYLTALDTPKKEQMRVQGVIYGLGAAALVVAHLGSGILRAETLPLSAALVPPAMLGMWLGSQVQDRIDQETFRRATLLVLCIAALNLVRRAVMG